MEWIVIEGDQAGAGRLALSARGTGNSAIWNALLAAGARGLGPPPSP